MHFKSQYQHHRSTTYQYLLFAIATVAGIGLAQLAGAQFQSLKFRNIHSENGLSHNTVTCIGQDSLGFMWFGTFNGINRFDGQSFKQYVATPKNNNGLSINRAINIYCDPSGLLWVRTIDSTLHRYSYETDEFVRYQPGNVPLEVQQAMRKQADEEIFNYKNHLIKFQREKSRWFTYTDLNTGQSTNEIANTDNPQGIHDSYITSVFVDKEHQLWVGTFNSGIYMADLDREPFHHFSFPQGTGLEEANIIRAIYQDDAHLWLGTRDQGLLKLDNHFRILAHYRHHPQNHRSLVSNDVRKIYKDSKKRLWIATRGGICIFDETSNGFNTIMKGSSDDISTYVFNVFEDQSNTIWFATLSGLKRYNESTSTIDAVGEDNGVESHPALRVVMADADDNLWIGSEVGGLTCLKRKDKPGNAVQMFESVRYINTPNSPTSLSDNRVYSACMDECGQLWFGTGAGLNRFNPQTNGFDIVTVRNGLSNDMVLGILPDDNGHVWVSHKRGISRVDIRTLAVVNFALADGLQSSEFNEDAYFRNPLTGELFFGGPNGINYFKPQSIIPQSIPVKMAITQLIVNGEPVNIGDSINGRVILEKNIVLTRQIVLTRHETSFSLEFNGLNYASPENVQYAYMLEGFDKKWNTTDAKMRRAYYTTLPPKTYVFKVKARRHDGTWPEEGTTMTIVIEPPFWQTLWFQIGTILLLISSTGSLVYFRMNRLKRQNLMLEKRVNERTYELIESNNQIKAQLNQIAEQNTIILSKNEEIVAQSEMLAEQKSHIENSYEELDLYRNQLEKLVEQRTLELQQAKDKAEESDRLKTSFLSNLSHEVRTPLNAIIGFTSFLLDETFNKREKKDFKAVIDVNCNSLLYLIEDIVTFSKIEALDIELNMARIPMSNILLQLPTVYNHEMSRQQFGKSDKSKLLFRIGNNISDDAISLFTDETRVVQIFSYLINNAIKYTHQGVVEAGCYLADNDSVCFYVKDTGIGIGTDDQAYIFNRFRKVENTNADVYRGVGLGLSITQQLVKLLGGTLSVQSVLGKGSTFSFVLPLKGPQGMDAPSVLEQSADPIPNLSHCSILIAEGDVGHYLHLQRLLNKTGAVVVHAFNGKQLMDIYQRHPDVSLILMELKLPDMDGWKAMEELKDKGIDVPVVAQTAFVFESGIEKIMMAGFTDVISKPIAKDSLYALLKKLLAN